MKQNLTIPAVLKIAGDCIEEEAFEYERKLTFWHDFSRSNLVSDENAIADNSSKVKLDLKANPPSGWVPNFLCYTYYFSISDRPLRCGWATGHAIIWAGSTPMASSAPIVHGMPHGCHSAGCGGGGLCACEDMSATPKPSPNPNPTQP